MSTFTLHKNDNARAGVLANLISFVSDLPTTKSFRISVEPYAKEKSDIQNKALWGLAYKIIREERGLDPNDTHEFMCGEHFGWVEYEVFGKKKLRPARTTTTDFDGRSKKLSTIEFAQFFDFIQRRAAQDGVFIPDPDPLWREHKRNAA